MTMITAPVATAQGALISTVVKDVTPLNALGARIRAAMAKVEKSREEWIAGSLDLIVALAEARERFKSNKAFGIWLAHEGLDNIGRNDRSALIAMATCMETTRIVLGETTRVSYQLIWDQEIKPRLPSDRKMEAAPSQPRLPSPGKTNGTRNPADMALVDCGVERPKEKERSQVAVGNSSDPAEAAERRKSEYVADEAQEAQPDAPEIELHAQPVNEAQPQADAEVGPDTEDDTADTPDEDEDYRPPGRSRRRQSRPARWADAAARAVAALEELTELKGEYEDWRESLPENLSGSPVAEKLGAVCDLDFASALEVVHEAECADLPRGFGLD